MEKYGIDKEKKFDKVGYFIRFKKEWMK